MYKKNWLLLKNPTCRFQCYKTIKYWERCLCKKKEKKRSIDWIEGKKLDGWLPQPGNWQIEVMLRHFPSVAPSMSFICHLHPWMSSMDFSHVLQSFGAILAKIGNLCEQNVTHIQCIDETISSMDESVIFGYQPWMKKSHP